MKRDLLSGIERLLFLMDDNRVEMLARQHGIRQKRDDGGVKKTFTAFVRRADEGTLSRLVVEASILLAASRGNSTVILKKPPPPTRWTPTPSPPRYVRSLLQRRRPRGRHNQPPRVQRKQPSASHLRGGESAAPRINRAQEEPALVSPPTLIPLPALARRLRGRRYAPVILLAPLIRRNALYGHANGCLCRSFAAT
jgi:hypothetical protein